MYDDAQAPVSDTAILAERIVQLATSLAPALRRFDEHGARYELAGPPGVAWFVRDLREDVIRHVSSSPGVDVGTAFDTLVRATLRVLELDGDNSHLHPLVLASMYLADPEARQRHDFDRFLRMPARIRAVDDEAARHDPELSPGDGLLRVWVPLAAVHLQDPGPHTAVVELHFSADRRPRYAPWEGAAGEVTSGGRVPSGSA